MEKLLKIAVVGIFLGCITVSQQNSPGRPRPPKTKMECPDPCTQKPLDIAFVIDSSSSIWPENFTLGLWFVEDFVDIFNVGPNNVRMSIVTYGDRVYKSDAFGFDQFSESTSLKKAITNIPFRGGNATETGQGIQYMRETYLTHSRPGVKTVVIVMTDGNSQNPEFTAEQARLTREAGLEMFAVGIGHSVSEEELRNIAGKDDHVFVVTSYNLLGTIRSRLAFETCGKKPVPSIVCRDNPIDISLVIDASSSIGEKNFTLALDFIKNFVESFDVGPAHVRFSVITYGRGTYDNTAFDFDTYNEELNVINAVMKIPYTAGDYTDTGLGIQYMREKQMVPKMRPEAAHICIVLTDGQSQDWEKTNSEAAKARDAGISMFAIGVGVHVQQEELENIGGKADHVFTVTDYKALESIHTGLDEKTCTVVLQLFHQHGVSAMYDQK